MSTFSDIIFVSSELLVKALRRVKAVEFLGISIDLSEQRSLDERLARLDTAKLHIKESLSAIEELQIAAKENKEQAEEALKRLTQIEEEKNKAHAELSEVRKLATADISTFQKLAGVPSRSQIKRERVIGFIFGILSSLIASGLIYLGAVIIVSVRLGAT